MTLLQAMLPKLPLPLTSKPTIPTPKQLLQLPTNQLLNPMSPQTVLSSRFMTEIPLSRWAEGALETNCVVVTATYVFVDLLD